MGLAVAVAGGADFLHWKCVKPRKVIYFDGELAEVTITERLKLALDGLSQSERALARDNLIIFNRDAAFNELGVELRAIDTSLGKQQVEFLVAQHGADLAVFDSRFSLLDAEMKEEGSVAKRLTLSMRNRRCCNIWLHHSGKDAKRGGLRGQDCRVSDGLQY
jgi:RecA-family ATPase